MNKNFELEKESKLENSFERENGLAQKNMLEHEKGHVQEKCMQVFADNLRYLIGDESVFGISKKIGITQQTLHRYLHCQREIGLANLIKIADYFGEDLDYLTGRKT